MSPEKLMRTCIACGQTDDHPRHVIDVGEPDALVTFHMDCHAISTGCETCKTQTQGAAGKTGDALRAHIVEAGEEN